MHRILTALIVTCLFATAVASPGAARAADAPKKLLLVTQSAGFDHEVVKRKDGKPSVVEQTFDALAKRTGAFTVEATRDASVVTPEKLKSVDVVVFYTTGKLPMNPDDLDAWVKGGGLFLGLHSATDTFHDTPLYQKLIGGEFQEHPWNQDTPVTIKVLDPEHAAAKPFADGGRDFKEEIYRQKSFNPEAEHVCLGLDMEKTALKKPYFVPIAWCHQHGKGRVFYTSLGHREDVWTNPRYQQHLVQAIDWLTGKAPGDAKPNPEISKREDEIAKKAAPPDPKAHPRPPTTAASN